MAVKSVDISSIEAKRFTKDKPNNVRVDHNVSIVTVKEEGDNSLIEYTYTVSYGHLGMIRLEGTVLYGGKALAHKWGEKRKIPDESLEKVYNIIMDTGSFEALIISKKLNLPPPIPLKVPRIKVEKGKTSGKVVHGPEVA